MSGDDEVPTGEPEPIPGDDASSNQTTEGTNEPTKVGARRWVVPAAVLVVAALVVAVILAVNGSDSDDDNTSTAGESTSTSTTNSESPTTSSAPATSVVTGEPTPAPTTPASSTPASSAPSGSTQPGSTAPITTPVTSVPASGAPVTTAPGSGDPLSQAVWPAPDSDQRFSDPVEAARSFATDFVGFVGANFGEFTANENDPRSGEVEMRIGEAGPATKVFVSQLAADDTWWVTGSGTQNIVVQDPDALMPIGSPLTITGLALSANGKVDVKLYGDGTDDPLFEGIVPAGSPDLEPYEETFEFENPGVGGGTLVMTIAAPNTQTVLEAEVLRYYFQPA